METRWDNVAFLKRIYTNTVITILLVGYKYVLMPFDEAW